MKHIKRITILFLSISMLGCYYRPDIYDDISSLSTINSNIGQVKDLLASSSKSKNICFTNKSEMLIRYSNNIKIFENDTIYYLGYTKSIYREENNLSKYSSLVFAKYFFSNGLYHAIELFNQDTLYHYTSLEPVENSHFFADYSFKKGKYFFMFQRSREYDTFGQEIFFYYNYDSLTNVKGNITPALPSIDSISMKDFYNSEFYKNFKKDKPYLF